MRYLFLLCIFMSLLHAHTPCVMHLFHIYHVINPSTVTTCLNFLYARYLPMEPEPMVQDCDGKLLIYIPVPGAQIYAAAIPTHGDSHV